MDIGQETQLLFCKTGISCEFSFVRKHLISSPASNARRTQQSRSQQGNSRSSAVRNAHALLFVYIRKGDKHT